jgi:hypothetical protein
VRVTSVGLMGERYCGRHTHITAFAPDCRDLRKQKRPQKLGPR